MSKGEPGGFGAVVEFGMMLSGGSDSGGRSRSLNDALEGELEGALEGKGVVFVTGRENWLGGICGGLLIALHDREGGGS